MFSCRIALKETANRRKWNYLLLTLVQETTGSKNFKRPRKETLKLLIES